METYNQISERPFSLFYFLAGKERDDDFRMTQKEDRAIRSIGVVSLLVAISNAYLIGISLDKYIEYQLVSIIFGSITFLFLLFFHRTIFIYSDAKSKSKAVVICFYIGIYLFLSYTESKNFLYYFLDQEIALLHKNKSSLHLAEGLIIVLQNLNTNERRSVQNLRFLVTIIIFLWSLLPLINHWLYTKNQDSKIDIQTQVLIQSLQSKLIEKKQEFANLNAVSIDPNDPFADPSNQESLESKREQILSEIIHLQRSIAIL